MEQTPPEIRLRKKSRLLTISFDDGSSFDASLSSSVRAGVIENGLRYHGFRKDRTYYPFPNDENEQNRDDMKHAMTGMMMGGKLHFAPIGDSPQSILDLGNDFWSICSY